MTNSTWAKETFTAYLRGLLEAGVKVTEIATNLGVHKDTVYAWKGSNEKRHISEATAIKLLVRMESLVTQYLPTALLPKEELAATTEDTPTDSFQAYQPGQVLTVKDLAAELGTTPKTLRRWLRKRFGKAQEGTWTFTLEVAEQVKTDFTKKAPADPETTLPETDAKCSNCGEVRFKEDMFQDEDPDSGEVTYICKDCLETVSKG